MADDRPPLYAARLDSFKVGAEAYRPGKNRIAALVTASGGCGAVVVSAANRSIRAEAIDIPGSVEIVPLQNEVPEAVNALVAERGRAGLFRCAC